MRRLQFSTRSDWEVLAWMLFMHLGALAALFTFNWKAFFVCLFLWWLTGGIGICLGYHRYFTHRSFDTPRWIQYLLAFFGTMAGEAGPIKWVAAHRYHHTYSDDAERDPHSPRNGFWWSHMSWLFNREEFLAKYDSYKKYAPDMAKDPVIRFLDKYHYLSIFMLAALLYALGGWPFIAWGIFLRAILVYHSTWLVNSASHVWGYRSFKTEDLSRNNWWVALLTFGEGWHNNHHAFQRSARHGFRWWEVDATYITIRIMGLLGLAHHIQVPVLNDATPGLTAPRRR